MIPLLLLLILPPGEARAQDTTTRTDEVWHLLERLHASPHADSSAPDTSVAPPKAPSVDCGEVTSSVLHLEGRPYAECLYAWMQSLGVSNFVLPTGERAYVQWDGTYTSVDTLYNYYLIWGAKNRIENAPGELFTTEPEWFVLDNGDGRGIIAGDTLHYARYANNVAPWVASSLRGADGSEANPYYQSAPLCNRALVSVAVDMIESDYWHNFNSHPWGTGVWAREDARFLGGLLMYWSDTFLACRDVATLDTSAKAAFEAGFARMLGKLRAQSAGRTTPNMKTRVIPAAANIYQITGEDSVKTLALETVRKFMFGYEDGEWLTRHHAKNALIYPAGYFQEGHGPETTYEGVSLYHVLGARARTKGLSEWAFLDAPLRQFLRWRTHQLFVDPDGLVYGPSGYAGRTGAGVERLQSGAPWRDPTAAGLFVEGLSLLDAPPHERGLAWSTGNWFAKNNDAFDANSSQAMPLWRIDHDHHWPAHTPYFPPAGTYDLLDSLFQAGDKTLSLPALREGYYYSESFGDDFWMGKGSSGAEDFAFVVETEADGGTYGGYRGGSLQGFWTRTGGVFLLARKNKGERTLDYVERYPTHHVWGITSPEGERFSTAILQHRDVQYWGEPNSVDSVSVSGEVARGISVDNRFSIIPGGLRLRHVVTSPGAASVGDLWMTLPVHLRICDSDGVRSRSTRGNACGVPDARVEYDSSGTWQSLPQSLVPSGSLRISRDWTNGGGGVEHAYVTCQAGAGLSSVQMRAGPVWQQTYQSASRIIPVHIALTDVPGALAALPARVELTCDITTD